MYLVLCSAADRAALWAAQQLRAHGLAPLAIVSPQELLCARTWEHRVDRPGCARTRIVLRDGRELNSAVIAGVLNRIDRLPTATFAAASPTDREYAEQEWAALLLSWLASLRGVLNPPLAQGLVGGTRDARFWTWHAAAAGLPVRDEKIGKMIHVVVFADEVFGPVPDAPSPALLRLAKLTHTPLLGVNLFRGIRSPWQFHSASPFPDFRVGGPALVAALCRRLQQIAAHAPADANVSTATEAKTRNTP
jgi:hypothetical protein